MLQTKYLRPHDPIYWKETWTNHMTKFNLGKFRSCKFNGRVKKVFKKYLRSLYFGKFQNSSNRGESLEKKFGRPMQRLKGYVYPLLPHPTHFIGENLHGVLLSWSRFSLIAARYCWTPAHVQDRAVRRRLHRPSSKTTVVVPSSVLCLKHHLSSSDAGITRSWSCLPALCTTQRPLQKNPVYHPSPLTILKTFFKVLWHTLISFPKKPMLVLICQMVLTLVLFFDIFVCSLFRSPSLSKRLSFCISHSLYRLIEVVPEWMTKIFSQPRVRERERERNPLLILASHERKREKKHNIACRCTFQ